MSRCTSGFQGFTRRPKSKSIILYELSTIVADACTKLKEGIDQKSGKKLVKFSFSFDGILPSGVEVFTAQKYSSQESALPEAILKQVKKEEYHDNIYVIDRGLQSTRSMKEFDGQSVKFHSFER